MSTVKSAGKVLNIAKALVGHSLTGISIKEIADKLGEPSSQVHRGLQTLIDAGFAKQEPNGMYTLGITLIQIAKAHDTEVQRAKARIAEVEQRSSVSIY